MAPDYSLGSGQLALQMVERHLVGVRYGYFEVVGFFERRLYRVKVISV